LVPESIPRYEGICVKKIVIRGTERTAQALAEYLKDNPCPNITDTCMTGPTVTTLFVPDELFDSVLSKVKEMPDISAHESLIEVSSPDFVISPVLDEIRERLAEKPKEKPGGAARNRRICSNPRNVIPISTRAR